VLDGSRGRKLIPCEDWKRSPVSAEMTPNGGAVDITRLQEVRGGSQPGHSRPTGLEVCCWEVGVGSSDGSVKKTNASRRCPYEEAALVQCGPSVTTAEGRFVSHNDVNSSVSGRVFRPGDPPILIDAR